MDKIEFTQWHEGKLRTFELTNPSGGGEGYYVMIDRYYNGTIVKLKGQWVGHMNLKCKLTPEEIAKLGEIIDKTGS